MSSRVRSLAWRYGWLGALALVVLVVVALQLGRGRQRRQLVETELARLRSLGVPVTAEELTLYAAVPRGTRDTTALWQAAVDAFDYRFIGRPPYGLKMLDELHHVPPLPGEPWDELEAAEAFIQQHAQLYSAIDTAAAAPGEGLLVADYTEGASQLLPHVDACWRMLELLRLRAYVHLHRGDPAAAVRDIEFMLAGAGMLRREPIAVSQHSYRRDTERAILTLERLLPYLLEEQAALGRIAQRLERFDARQNLHRGNLGNRVMGLTTLDDPTTAGAAGVPSTLYAAWVRDNKHKLLETLRQLDQTLASPWPAPLIAAQEREQVPHGQADVTSPWGRNDWLSPTEFAKDLLKTVDLHAQVEARAKAACVAIAAVQFEAGESRWPTSLQELIPEHLDSVPIDPFSGDPLQLIADDRVVRIYSIGPDMLDNGGVETPEVAQGGHPVRAGKPDVVFELRRSSAATPAE